MSGTFNYYGPMANWAIEICTLALFLGVWSVTYRRLVPAKEPSIDDETSYSKSLDEQSTETESISY